jgi:hypothetical protein
MTAKMEVEGATDKPETQKPSSSKEGRPPPIVLATAINLMQLQKRIKAIVASNFELRNTRSGTTIVTKEMADFSAIRKHIEDNNKIITSPISPFFRNRKNQSRL